MRVIYFFVHPPGRVYLASIFAKSRKEALTPEEENLLAKLATAIKTEIRRKQ